MVSIRDIGLIVIILGTIPLIFWRPWIGVLVWSWVGYMNPHKLTWGIMNDAPIAMVVMVVLLVSWLISREPKKIPVTPITILLGFFTAWFCITTVFAIQPEAALEKWDKAIKVMIGTVLTLALMYTRQRLNMLIAVIVASIGLYSFKGGIFTILTGGQWLVWGPQGSFIASNNALALGTIMLIPMIRYLHMEATTLWIKWGLMIMMGLSIVSVAGSYSRGAFLAIFAMIIVLIIKSRRRFILIAVAFLGISIALTIVPQKWYDRMQTITTYQEQKSVQTRFQAWKFAYELAKDRPVVGGGFLAGTNTPLFLSYVPEAETSRAAHSIYFEVLGEHGFVGLFIFLLLGAITLLTGTWIISRTKNRPDLRWAENLASMLQVSIVGYAVGGAFLSKATFDFYYQLMAMMVILSILVKKELKASQGQLAVPPASARQMPIRPPAPAGALGRSPAE